MAGGPADEVKRASAEKDASHDIYETWTHLFKNFAIVAVIAASTWLLVSGVRFSIEIGSEFLFEPFAEIHAEKGEHAGKGFSHEKVPEGAKEAAKKAEHEVAEVKKEAAKLAKKMEGGEGEAHGAKKEGEAKEGEGGEHEVDLDTAAWTIFAVLVVGGLIRGVLLQIPSWKTSEGDGMGTSLEYFHASYLQEDDGPQPRYEKPDFLQALRRAILTSLTVGTGGSGGIEAPVVPIGECIGAGWSRVLNIMKADDVRIYQLAGISAAVATLLDAPFTAALFAAEVVYNARILYRTLMYSLIGAIVAFALNNHFLAFEPLFNPTAHSFAYTIKEYLEVTVVAIICSAPAGLGIAWLFKRLKKLISPAPGVLKPVVGAIGAGSIGMAIWFGFGLEPQHVLGVSEETIIQVMLGEGNPLLKVWWVLLMLVLAKALATGFTLMAGGSAGALVPAMYLGAISGAAIFFVLQELGYHTDADVSVFVVAGLASALVAVVQVPLAAITFVMEVFGAFYGPPAIVACVLTYMLARRWKLYTLPTLNTEDSGDDDAGGAEASDGDGGGGAPPEPEKA